ncbi:glycosyltransferase [Thermomonospora cellulosilytica]|uniref:Alpha-1,6-mannosyltransferase n=1 Tax=Thermomonospora cellulosilytica TaxID=1411118 RepID=A0A7W3R9F1_9ACTN|nr:glycosyltransferase [Thermomonospora cellulosilytica]MBA9004697.1 alpha-1,6-mannosyltransferase [Thermomonospora cellulosilytica]
MKIVQLANLYSPVSGGLRTAVNMLGQGYAAAGHERTLVIPGRAYTRSVTAAGTVVTVPGPSVAPGYRIVLDPGPVLRVLSRVRPDVIEVSDKATLTVTARWARRHGARAVLLSHERLDAILSPRVPGWVPLDAMADRWNRRLAGMFDAIVTPSRFAAAEFARVGARSVHRVPLGVDLATFRPMDRERDDTVRLVHLGRLSKEKNPWLALHTARELRARGLDVRLDVIGDGPERRRLHRAATALGLPVTFHGHVPGRIQVARLLAAADVALATCPVEAFGLAVLEAMACGTPVVAADTGAAGELLAPRAGIVAPACPAGFADGVQALLRVPEPVRRAAARARAERYPWERAVTRMLEVLAGP